jgi:hypothetical protein
MAFQTEKSDRDAIAALVILGCDTVCAFASRSFLERKTVMKKQTTTTTKTTAQPTFLDRCDSVRWVYGVSTPGAAAGVAYHEGNLCQVKISGSNLESQKIGHGPAAEMMAGLRETEMMLNLDAQVDDEGFCRFMREGAAVTTK